MVPCDEYADLAVETITGPVCSQSYGSPLNYLCWLVGTQVYNRYAVQRKEKSGVVDKVCKLLLMYYGSRELHIRMVGS